MPLLPTVEEDEEMKEDEDDMYQVPMFSTQDVDNAAKVSNFFKGLGPDCFDGNILKNNDELRKKLVFEITDAMNSQTIPDYLRSGRLVPL
jgi:hypothetical protein